MKKDSLYESTTHHQLQEGAETTPNVQRTIQGNAGASKWPIRIGGST
nr:unnamed protein product [Callosobruchus analis]